MTGDDSFDQEFWIYSNLLEEAKHYFEDSHHRTAIRILYQNQWRGLYISGNRIKAATTVITPDVSPVLLNDALDKMLDLQITN